MNLNESPKAVQWPETHYAFVERIGPFQTNAHEAWQDLHSFVARIAEHNQITRYMSLYKVETKVYRAGVSLSGTAEALPEGVGYMKFHGGKYSCFVLTGPYSDLAEASGRVFALAAGMPLREDYFIENYVNDPRTTPAEQLITEILVPTV
jgi:effector-binding domain-containing protein